MSANAATADMWVADLEDILGLSPVGRQDAGAGRNQPDGPARSRTIYVAVAALALVTLVVSVAETDFSVSIGGRNPDKQQLARTRPRLVKPDRSRMTGALDTALIQNTGRDAVPVVAGLTETGKSRHLGSEAGATGWQLARPMSLHGMGQASRAGNAIDAGGKAVALPPAAVVGREVAAASDLASPSPGPSRGTSLPGAGPGVDDVRLVTAPPSPLRPSGPTGGTLGQPDRMSSADAGMTPAVGISEKAPKKAGAIDALRMLRRQ